MTLINLGPRMTVSGRITATIVLELGPLDGAWFTVHLDGLDDLPLGLTYQDGRYVPRRDPDGAWWHTTYGQPVYTWEPS